MSLADDADLWSQIRLMVRAELTRWHDGGSIVCDDGIIMPGSYNPKDGTVSVGKVETASLIDDDTEKPLPLQGVQLATPVHGQQAGPVGGERVILIRRHSGWLAILEHGEDDSPKAPAGEHHYVHSTGSFQKFQNSGNVSVNANAEHQITSATISHTASGNATHEAQNTTINSTSNTQMNAVNVAIAGSAGAAMIAPSTMVGPAGGPYLNIGSGGLGAAYAVVRVTDLTALLTWLASHDHGNGNGGGNTTGPTSAPPSVSGSSVTSTG